MPVVAVEQRGKTLVELVELVVEAMDHQVGRVNLLQLLKQQAQTILVVEVDQVVLMQVLDHQLILLADRV
jgi:hypothetical protein